MTYKQIKNVPETNSDSVAHRRQIAKAINELIETLIPNSVGVKPR